LEDFLGRAVSRNRYEEIALAIKIGEGGGARFVGLHADTNRLRPIIFTLRQPATAMVADTRGLGRACFDMEDGFAIRAGSATAQPGHNLLQGKFVAQYAVELKPVFSEQFFECLSLGNGAGKAIQEKATFAAQAADPFGNQGQHCVVRD
jgi:hypothetical protein